MKKIIAILMAICMLTALCACGTPANGSGSTGSGSQTQSQPDSDTTEPDASTPDTTEPDASTPDTTEPDSSSPDASAPDQADPDTSAAGAGRDEADPAAELVSILTAISTEYHSGVSGSSLTAAKFAGQLLDWNAQYKLTDDEIKTATNGFFVNVGQDASVEFVDNFTAILDAARSLCGDTAQDILDSCGYEAVSFPWAEADMTALFTAIYSGLGVDMPAAA